MQGQERARCLATAEELCRIAGELNLLAELQADWTPGEWPDDAAGTGAREQHDEPGCYGRVTA